MNVPQSPVAIIGAGTLGTALGNILAETGRGDILLHTIEPGVAEDITGIHINRKYFPTLRLNPALHATTDNRSLEDRRILFLAIPSVSMIGYLESIRQHIAPGAILVNLAKGFGAGNRTIVECLPELFPNPLITMKGPSFAREIINRLPTGFTLGYRDPEPMRTVAQLFEGTNIHFDESGDIRGVEILSILKNIYAIALGIVDAQFNSPNLRFLILTNAFREMRQLLHFYGGTDDTLFNYCGYGDFTLTALNDLSRNRTLGLLIGKGFFTEHVSHELVLEGKTAAGIFYRDLAASVDVAEKFPIMEELHRIFQEKYDITAFVNNLLK